MKFSLDKYKYAFFKDESGKDTVCARSTYAGKTVKGYAKCDPRDSYDVESGKALAAARCNAKIAEKRVARAQRQVAKANKDWATSDKIRNELTALGFAIKDTKDGFEWSL